MDDKQEFIDEPENKQEESTNQEESRSLTIVEYLQLELRQHMTIALDYKQKIDSAKTKAKKEYYTKKLKKNNIQATKVLTAIERVTQKKQKNDDLVA